MTSQTAHNQHTTSTALWWVVQRYGFNGQEVESMSIVNSCLYDFSLRQFDCRIGRWLSRDPYDQLLLSPYLAFANNPILLVDIEGGWIPGIRPDGTLYLLKEKGDNSKSLIRFLGGGNRSTKFIDEKYFQYAPALVVLSDFNTFTQGTKWYSTEGDNGIGSQWSNTTCHGVALLGSRNQSLVDLGGEGNLLNNITPESRDRILDGQYDELHRNNEGDFRFKENAVFGETILVLNDRHSAVYFGSDQEGNSYFLSKHNKDGYTIDKYEDIVKAYGVKENEAKVYTIKPEFIDKTLTNDDVKE